ncbi:origin recognition complex subunit 4 [Sporothrix eucalyptigena]
MSGGIGRKRARSEDGDNGGADENMPIGGVAGTGMGTIKRQRLANTASVVNGGSGLADDAALFPGPDIATTPKTPRTMQAVASAISGAFGSLVSGGGNKARDRLMPRPFTSLLNQSNARTTSQRDHDKIYDVPGDDGENNVASPTAAALTQLAADGDLEGTLVGSASPTPNTPSKKQPSSATKTAVATVTPGGDKKKRRDLLGDLAIDGTDKLKNGNEESLSRQSRVRSTPKRYFDNGVDASHSSSASRSSRPRTTKPTAKTVEPESAPTTDCADTAPIIVSTEAPAAEASPAPAAPTVEGDGTTSSTRKRGRPAAKKPASAANTPTKAPVSTRKIAGSKSDAAAGDNNTPTSTKRARAGPTPKRDRRKSASKDTPAEPASEHPLQDVPATEELQEIVEEDDNDICAICSKPDSEPPNEIVFCEACNLAVHQQCYNVPVIPEGDWFCKNCVLKQQQKSAEPKINGENETQENGTAAPEEDEIVSAERVATEAIRDLAPDIANFEHHLAKMKRTLLGRCTGRQRIRLQGQDEAYDKVLQVVKQTVVAGEGNSMMVIGARGTGKTTMVESILGDLAAEHGGAFHVVRLNGFIHTDDKLALREIWRQLGKEMAVEDDIVNKTNNYADTLASLLALLSHPSEILAATIGTGEGPATAAAPAVTSTAVVFVIDEFDLFATHARQTLLYNLFDIAQARKAPIAVLGLTTKIDVVESLEKRVKSRFSHRYVYLSLARNLQAFWDICRLGLVADNDTDDKELHAIDIDEKEGHAEFRQWWKHMIETAKDDAHFQDQLLFHYYSSKSVPAFWTMCIMPLAAVSLAAPRLRLPPVGKSALGGILGASNEGGVRRGVGRPPRAAAAAVGSNGEPVTKSLDDVDPLPLAPPDSKLHLLAALSELELSLLISAARLDIVLSTDTVNFAMAYDEYVSLMSRQRVQASLAGSGLGGVGAINSGRGVGRPPGGSTTVVGGGARVWGRGVASRAWERLAALGLLIPAGLGASSRGRGGGSALVTSGLEGRSMWRTEVALEEIAAAPGVRLGAVLARWCKEI